MKKRKLLITLLTLAFSATSAFALASCDDSTANEPTQTVEMPVMNTESLHYQKIKGKEAYRVIGLGTVSDYKVTIPASYRGLPVTEIAPDAFRDSTYLTEVVIGDSVTTIGSSAFSGCDSLTEVVIPDSVTTIGERAFNDCTSLTEINVSENNTAYKAIDGNLYTKDGTTLLQYAIGKTATSFTIPDSVTKIGYRAFAWCDSLTIYCEAESKPDGWDSDWNPSDRPVVWGYTGE